MGACIVLWNYRSYGRSEGTPSIPRLCKDGELIVNYIRNARQVKTIIVHGESLGGSIASHIAYKCDCDLLVADRTFSSLFETIRSYIGFIPACLIKLIGPSDIDSVKNYLEFNKKKILTCDPKDEVINDKASLKCGIARMRKNENKVSTEEMNEFLKAIENLNGYRLKYSVIETTKKKGYKVSGKKIVYKTLNTEEIEFGIENLIVQFLQIADKMDAVGVNIVEIMQKDKKSIED